MIDNGLIRSYQTLRHIKPRFTYSSIHVWNIFMKLEYNDVDIGHLDNQYKVNTYFYLERD